MAVFVAGWRICQYSILYPQHPWGWNGRTIWHIVYAFSTSYYQMFGELFTENVIASRPYDMYSAQDVAEGFCTNNASEYNNFENIRCPNTHANWIVYLLLMIFLIISNLLLLNLLIAIFSNTYEQIESMYLILNSILISYAFASLIHQIFIISIADFCHALWFNHSLIFDVESR